MVGRIATGEIEEATPPPDGKTRLRSRSGARSHPRWLLASLTSFGTSKISFSRKETKVWRPIGNTERA